MIRQAWSAGGNISSVNLGESFMVVGENAEGLFEMYLFKPVSGFDAVGVHRSYPPFK